ncbi:MAG: preprotein translocase subunit SecG [Opitutae bacterium]|nr:preprotein translocase subunit SecG [Opitutae bacterium]
MSSILISILLIVEVLAAFLLVVVILAQKSKDQGLGMAFGSGMGESLFGSRAGNVLTRMTITLATVFMLTTIVLGILFANRSVGSGSVMEKADREAPLAPVAPMAAPQPAAPLSMDEMPMDLPAAEASAPMVLQMGEGGELAPAEAIPPDEGSVPVAEEQPAEGEPAPQD